MIFKADSVEEYSLKQDLELIKKASQQSKELLEEIVNLIKPGIKESEVYAKTKIIYDRHGIKRSWHKPYIKFGYNTAITYDEKVTEDFVLQENDIAFVDIGPIWGDTEGDICCNLVDI